MQIEKTLLLDVEAYVSNFIAEQVSKEYAYHDVQHTVNVVNAALEIGKAYELTDKDLEILQLAAWFHDTGYDKGSIDHEERGANYAKEYLAKYNYPEQDLAKISACIRATKIPHQPNNLLEKIICDADLSHLGKKNYWNRCGKVRQELTLTKGLTMGEQEWVDFELKFISAHSYHTDIAQSFYSNRKNKHIRQLKKRYAQLDPDQAFSVEDIARKEKKWKKKNKNKPPKIKGNTSKQELKELSLGRGVETMYRTTYRTHVNLSSIADNKANIMLSINAIVISISLSSLVPNFDQHPKFIIPTMILLVVCLLSIIFATLSTRPKITEGIFTREDIKNKKSNLLFFGNFYNMQLDDFHWGMMEMIKDTDFLYSSMTRDLYYLGVVLAKKYEYLRYCYTIFMYGLIIAVLGFALVFML